MREHEDGMDDDFWRNAEKLVGVGYDGAVLGVEEDPDPDDAGERFTAWVAPPETHADHRKWKFDLRDTGATRRDAIEELARRVYRELRKRAYAQLRDALPYSEWRRMAEEAELLLSVDHTVVLGSRGDSEEQIAMSLLRKDYWQDVRSQAQNLIYQIKSGEISSYEEFYDRLREIDVVYTSDAHKTLWMSDNDDAYENEMGEKADRIEVAAAAAFQADIGERVQASIEIQQLREIDCPRCGKVVIWTDPDDGDDECRKCGYLTRVEVSRAYLDTKVVDEPIVCETCRADHPDETLNPVDHRKDFTCDECGADYTQPPEEPSTAPTEETPDGVPQP